LAGAQFSRLEPLIPVSLNQTEIGYDVLEQGFGTGTGFSIFQKNQNHWELGFLRTGTATKT
jgi:hypothetical protein